MPLMLIEDAYMQHETKIQKFRSIHERKKK